MEAFSLADLLASEENRGTRLDSWKAIAEHLGRSSRTAQRWHAEFDLPVYHLGGSCGSVFAYSDEIENWFQKHRVRLPVEKKATPSPLQMPSRRVHGGRTAGPLMPVAVDAACESRSQTLTADAYQRWTLLTESNLHTIVRLFRKAVDLDPNNAEAYAGLAHALIAQGMIDKVSLRTAFSAAQAAAERALEINPYSSEATCAKAWLDMTRNREWKSAGMLFERLLIEGPVTTRVMLGQTFLSIAQGDCETASDLSYDAAQQNLLSSLSLGPHIWSEYLAGSYTEVLDHIAEVRESGGFGRFFGAVEALTYAQCLPAHKAIARIRNLIEEDAKNQVAHGVLGYLLGVNGNEEQARGVMELLKGSHSHANDTAHYAIALIHLGLDEPEEAIRHIESSYQLGSIWSIGFHLDPILRSLNKEAKFKNFVSTAYPTVLKRYVLNTGTGRELESGESVLRSICR